MTVLVNRHEYECFLEVLRSVRENKRITQSELAKALNATQSFVSKCERGERRLDVVELKKWCQGLGIDFLHFVRQIGEPRTKAHK